MFQQRIAKEIIIEKVSNNENEIDDLNVFPNPCSGFFIFQERIYLMELNG